MSLSQFKIASKAAGYPGDLLQASRFTPPYGADDIKR